MEIGNSMLICTNRSKREVHQKNVVTKLTCTSLETRHLLRLIAKLSSRCDSSTWSSVKKWEWRSLQSNQSRKWRALTKNNMRLNVSYEFLKMHFAPFWKRDYWETSFPHLTNLPKNYGLKWLTICSNIQMSMKVKFCVFHFYVILKWKILVYIENKLYSFEIAFHVEVSFQAVWIILSHNTTIATFITGASQFMHKLP